jgi:hypothetical protein
VAGPQQVRDVAHRLLGQQRQRLGLDLEEGLAVGLEGGDVVLREGKKLDALQSGSVEAAVRRTMTRLDEAELDSARKVLTMLTDELGRTDR